MSVLWRELMDGEVEYRLFFVDSSRYMVAYDWDRVEGEDRVLGFGTTTEALSAWGDYVAALKRVNIAVPVVDMVGVVGVRVVSRCRV